MFWCDVSWILKIFLINMIHVQVWWLKFDARFNCVANHNRILEIIMGSEINFLHMPTYCFDMNIGLALIGKLWIMPQNCENSSNELCMIPQMAIIRSEYLSRYNIQYNFIIYRLYKMLIKHCKICIKYVYIHMIDVKDNTDARTPGKWC